MYAIRDRSASDTINNDLQELGISKLNQTSKSDFITNCFGRVKNLQQNNFVNIIQSPKIYSGNYRKKIENTQGYSLLDLKDKMMSKGPKFPFSYIRNMAVTPDGSFHNPQYSFSLIYENCKQPLLENREPNQVKNEKLNKNDMKFPSKLVIETNNNTIEKTNELPEDKLFNESIKTPDRINNFWRFENKIKQNQLKKVIFDNKNAKRVRTAGGYQPKKSGTNVNNQPVSRNHFEIQNNSGKEYERLIKSSQDSIRIGNIPISKFINQKMQKSDIFFIDNPIPNTHINQINGNLEHHSLPPIQKPDYSNSDIFALKNNEISYKKIGEKHLLLKNKYQKIGYYPGDESNSAWSPKYQVKSLINYNSLNYDIINPILKKTFYTKDKMTSEPNKNNPIHRQKGLTEFVDLTRNFVPNHNKDFLNAVTKDEKIFRKNQNLCANYLNLHKEYNNICDKPFIKKFY